MKLSVIIPVYNEINTVQEIIKKVNQVEIDKEIIIVDDFSTDGTRDLLTSLIRTERSDSVDGQDLFLVMTI